MYKSYKSGTKYEPEYGCVKILWNFLRRFGAKCDVQVLYKYYTCKQTFPALNQIG